MILLVHVLIHFLSHVVVLSGIELTGMCTANGEYTVPEGMCGKKLVISCRMMHNLIKIYHVVQEL